MSHIPHCWKSHNAAHMLLTFALHTMYSAAAFTRLDKYMILAVSVFRHSRKNGRIKLWQIHEFFAVFRYFGIPVQRYEVCTFNKSGNATLLSKQLLSSKPCSNNDATFSKTFELDFLCFSH